MSSVTGFPRVVPKQSVFYNEENKQLLFFLGAPPPSKETKNWMIMLLRLVTLKTLLYIVAKNVTTLTLLLLARSPRVPVM
jgi:hypothetical protein